MRSKDGDAVAIGSSQKAEATNAKTNCRTIAAALISATFVRLKVFPNEWHTGHTCELAFGYPFLKTLTVSNRMGAYSGLPG